MGQINKLLVPIGDKPLITRSFEIIVASPINRVVVILGHQAERVKQTLQSYMISMQTAKRSVCFIVNPAYQEGLSYSLRCGLNALSNEVDGIMVYLADMPFVSSRVIEKLIEAFDVLNGEKICVPINDHKQGNPILWPTRFSDKMKAIQGDKGARSLLDHHPDAVYEVTVDDPGILIDVDTPTCLADLCSKYTIIPNDQGPL